MTAANYLDELAIQIAREAGDYPFIGDYAGIELFRQYAVLLLAKGRAVTAEDVHNGWAAWASERRVHSHNIIPFAQLDWHTKEEDEPYAMAIRRVARSLVVTA